MGCIQNLKMLVKKTKESREKERDRERPNVVRSCRFVCLAAFLQFIRAGQALRSDINMASVIKIQQTTKSNVVNFVPKKYFVKDVKA